MPRLLRLPACRAAAALFTASVLLLAIAPGPPLVRASTAPAGPGDAPVWDLLTLAAPDAQPPASNRVTAISNFAQQRRVLAVPIPQRVAYPITIPAGASLDFGYALQSRIFSVDFIPKSGPTRFSVVFTDDAGGEHVLHDRIVNPRDRQEDRRWFDERIDLSALAGQSGTLAFSVAQADDPSQPGATTALWSTPRVLRAAAPDEKNLLFITIDCLRADRVGAYGYERPTTPTIDRIAAEGIRFAHAYTAAPMTLPSLPQIFTSTVFPKPESKTWVSPLVEAGVPAAAFVNNVWLVLWLARKAVPFDLTTSGDLMARRMVDESIAWVDRQRGTRFALYMHFLDIHTPYAAPTEYARRFADPAYQGRIPDTFGDVDLANSGQLDERDRRHVAALYDGNLRYIDDQLARLFAHLRERGLLDRTVVVISADHGEELWDHGRFFHGQSLYDELLHVPLIVRLPGAERAGTVVDRQVRSIDIAPFLVERAGFARPEGFTGRSLSEAIEHPGEPADPLVATATMGQFPTRYGLRTPEHKLIETIDTATRQLFDLEHDPAEKADVLAARPEVADALGTRLDAAREELLHDGVQMRIVGPKQGKARFRLTLKSTTENGIFETIDRTAAAPDTRVSLSSDGRILFLRGETDAGGRGFRFDRRLLLLAAAGGKSDPIRVLLAVDGHPAPPEVVWLGTGRPLDATRSFVASAPELEAAATPDCPPPDAGVRVCLWRPATAQPEPTPVILPIPDSSARERLRALGYVQ